MYNNINHKYFKMNKTDGLYAHEMTDSDYTEAKEALKRLRKVKHMEIAKDQDDAKSILKRGVCPHCHIVLPENGICDICGYEKGETSNLDKKYENTLKIRAGLVAYKSIYRTDERTSEIKVVILHKEKQIENTLPPSFEERLAKIKAGFAK